MFAKAPHRGIILANLLLALILSLVPVSRAHAQTTPSVNASGVPKVKASDHQGFDIGADTKKYVNELPSGAFVDRNLANGTGYSGYQIDDMAKLAKDENVIIGTRSTNVDSMRHIRDKTAVPKPLEIKAKTITELDTYLGAKPQDKGLVGYFQPKAPIESEVPKDLWKDVQKRHLDRVKEYEELRGSVNDLQRTGKVVERDGKLFAVAQNADGSPRIKPDGSPDIKPYAGDIDAVYFREVTVDKYGRRVPGEYIPPGERYDRLKRAWTGDGGTSEYWTKSGAPGQHGAEINMGADLTEGLKEGTPEYEAALKKAQKAHGKLAAAHLDGEVVLEMHPDGHLRRGTKFTADNPLPDLHKAGAATKAAGAADDVARAAGSLDDTAKAVGTAGDLKGAGGSLDDAAKAAGEVLDVGRNGSRIAGTASKAIGAFLDTLATLGHIADRVQVAADLLKLKSIYDTYAKAWDPATSDAEAAELLEKAQKMAQEVGGDASIFVLLETVPQRFPGVLGTGLPIAYLAWSLQCLHRDWGQAEATCTEDHYNALMRAWDELIGDKLERDAQRAADAKAQCDAFSRAVAEGRAKPKWPFTVNDVCDAIKQGWTTTDMRDDDGSHMARHCVGVEGRIGSAAALVGKGNLNDAQALLARARHWLGEFGAESCPGLAERVAGLLEDIEKAIAPQKAKAETALAQCRFGESLPLIGALPALQREALMERWNKASQADSEAKVLLAKAVAEKNAGKGAAARENLRKAKGLSPCEATLAAIAAELGREAQTAADSKSASQQPGGKDCDPNKVPPPKPDVTAGFAPVEYKGATAWTGATNPDCSPYGPAAKGPTNDGAGGEPTKLPAPKEPSCGKIDAALGRAREHYLAGRVSEYRIALVNARQEIGTIGDPKACAGQRDDIAKGDGRAELLDKVIKSADQALADCRPQQLQKLSGLLGKTSHPHVAQLRGRIDRMAAVATKIDQADAKLAGGDRVRAAALYREAAAGLNADGKACPALARHVRDAQARIQTASLTPKPESTALAKAETACKSNLGARAIAIPNPDSLTGFTCDCADPYALEGQACVRKKSTTEIADAAHNVCRTQFGSAAFAQPNTPDFKNYGCLCGKGYTWNDKNSQCIQQTQEQIMADAHASCQAANKNKRARAVKYLGDGQWSCTIERSKAEIMADAHRSCQQANGGNRRVRAGKQLPNGQWSCYIPGPRRVVSQQQPNYDAAAAAAAAAVILGGVNAIMQNRVSRPPAAHTRHCTPHLDINKPYRCD